MLKNYLLVTLRNLTRHKRYNLINIAGLAIGMTCFLLVALMVRDELSYDRMHKDADCIYRVTLDARVGEKEFVTATSSAAVAWTLQSSVPGVEAAARIRVVGDRSVRYLERAFTEYRFYLADSTIFRVFTFDVIEGDVTSFLTRPNTVVVTDEIARKYFGDAPALGKTLSVGAGERFTVCGVVRALPRQSHWHFGFLASTCSRRYDDEQPWTTNVWYNYVRLARGVSPARVEETFASITREHVVPVVRQMLGFDPETAGADRFHYRYLLEPIARIHLYSHLDGEIEPTGSIGTVSMFGIVALFVLLIACINFMNLNTARSSHRAKEVGVRKVLGSQRSQLVQLFLGEAMVLSLLSLLLSLGIVELALPWFNGFVGKDLSLGDVGALPLAASLVVFGALVGLAAGSFPAFILSSFQPVKVLKGEMRKGMRSGWLRGTLVVAQFAISIALMVGTIIVYRQLQFVQTKDLGFDKENLFVVDNTWLLGSRCESFRQTLLARPGVVAAAFTQNLPGNDIISAVYRAEGGDKSQFTMIRQLWVGYDYLQTLGVKLREGRFFSREFPADSADAVVINEAAARLLGYDHPVGRTLFGYFKSGEKALRIIGVAEDFHYEPLHLPLLPMVVLLSHGNPTRVVLRMRGDVRPIVSDVRAQWDAVSGGQPFTSFFLDQRLERYYRSDESLGVLFGILASLGIFLSCLGLLGLAMYATEQRRKEMGIRKVLGASAGRLSGLLAKEFTKLVVIANVISWPLAYFGMQRWLESFAYRIDLDFVDFGLAGLAALAISLATVAYHTLKVAVANPVESLRYE